VAPRIVRVEVWVGAIALAIGTFLAVTQETVIRHHTATQSSIDGVVLRWMSHLRSPRLTGAMVDITALGSPTLVTIFTLVTLAILIVLRDRRGALLLAIASVGAWILSASMKGLIGRARPTEVQHLVEVSGSSYPSGHSLAAAALYLTMALVAARHMRTTASKAVLVAGAFFLIAMVAVSRVYLGVHYPSDVLSGVSLGTAWALLLAAVATVIIGRRQ
jgi:undecaprenyl-diphosphatase